MVYDATKRPVASLALLVALLALVVTACGPKKAERIAAFRQKCVAAEFTPAQCVLLVQLYTATIDAKDDTAINDAASSATGIAIGAATGAVK